MKIKTLIWKDNITDEGKKLGLYGIISKIESLNLFYSISNYQMKDTIYISENNFYFNDGDADLEFPSLEEAKCYAQEVFKETVFELFFDEI